jgi:dihydrofolate synthase / folylpolyglutamate synthase
MTAASGPLLELYSRAAAYLEEGLIRTVLPEEPNPLTGRAWMERFLPAVGHPERSFGAIHVAGTSGKGSVATMIAEILRAAGVRTGLHVSPYLQVSTEKLWVDGLYASVEELASLVEWVRPAAEGARGAHVPVHALASVAIALEHLRRSRVELGVVEVGVGGRDDVTNVLATRVAVVSAVGLDHQRVLGGTIEEIARHKAGIIRPGCRAVAIDGPGARAALEEAAAVGARIRVVGPDLYRGSPDPDGRRIRLDYRGTRFRLDGCAIAMPGRFQASNAALAVAAVEELAAEDFAVTEGAVREGLARARIPGRLEEIPAERAGVCPVLLDGAHNPDKLEALLGALEGWPRRRLHVVYGALASRPGERALCRLADMASTLVLAEPRAYAKPPRPAAELARLVESQAGRRARVAVEPSPTAAVALALEAAAPGDLVLVTGSLYLCGEARDLFYPKAQVLEARTSWPSL